MIEVNQTTLMPGRILLVDDEVNICSGLKAILSRDGHEIRAVHSAEDALITLNSASCEVAIVDFGLPGVQGDELISILRNRWPHLAILLLTGHGTLESAMVAIRAGACDYLLKPAQPQQIRHAVWKALATMRERQQQAELLASLRTMLHQIDHLHSHNQIESVAQSTTTAAPRQFVVGDLIVECQTHEVWHNDKVISLTPSEFSLLQILAENSGNVVDYRTLAQATLGYTTEVWEAKELVKRHILTLRQKIEPTPDTPQYISNVRGIGYRLQQACQSTIHAR